MCVLAFSAPAAAQTGANVLLVVNTASSASETIARKYAERRDVPPDNLCAISLPVSESVAREVYEAKIEQPVWRCIATRQLHDRVHYIVLTKGVPIRISGTGSRSGTNASVDSELTLLYRRRTGLGVPIVGFVPNPYFAGAAPNEVEPFTHRSYDIYLVTRLDGYTLEDALALIDRAAEATSDGRFIFDKRQAFEDLMPNRWLAAAAARMKAQGLGDRVLLDETAKVVTGESQVLGYYSWGSSDDSIRVRSFGLTFVPGALAGMFVSTDGRTFKEPPESWQPGGSGHRDSLFAGSAESLMGDLIRAGATGVSGNVDEPYLDAAIRPDILFPAYARGRNLAEAYYAAMPYLSWQTIVVGDPLCAPFPHVAAAADAIDPPIDATTETPAYFGRRQLAAMPPALPIAAAAAYIRYQSRTLRNDEAGARQALEAAIVAEPRFIPARLALAAIDDRAGNHDQVIAQYRMIVFYSPNDPVALNNLAYGLAVYQNSLQEALQFAERAISVAKRPPAAFGGVHELASQYIVGKYDPETTLPSCLDTLAWVQHLLGHDFEAANTIRQARSAGGYEPAILWHAAVIYAAINDVARASQELSAALKADPNLANRDEIQRLRQQLDLVGKHPTK